MNTPHDLPRPRRAGLRMVVGVAMSLTLAVVALPGEAAAQATDQDLGDESAFLGLFPNLRNAPAPNFLVPGVRATYQAAGAVIGSDVPASGGGVIQYDVVTRDAGQILAVQQSYGNDGGGFFPLAASFARGYPGLGAFWINPQALVGAEGAAGGGLTVSRFAKDLANGGTVQVVRFQTTTQNGRTVFEFDTATGLLVFSSVTAGPSAAQLTLLNLRQLAMPWGLSRAPNWVRPGATVDFTGTKTTTIPGVGSPIQQPTAARIRVVRAGARWSVAEVTSSVAGIAQGTGAMVTGQAQLVSPLWLPVSALVDPLPTLPLRVDADPVTGITLDLSRAGDGSLVVEETSPVARRTWVYSPNWGVLNRAVEEIQTPTAHTVTDLGRVTGDGVFQELASQTPLPEDPGAAGSSGDPEPGGGPPDPGGEGDGAPGPGGGGVFGEPDDGGGDDGCAGSGGRAGGTLAAWGLAIAALWAGRRRLLPGARRVC